MSLPNFGNVIKKKFSRSGQPDAAGFKALADKGIKVIIKLSEGYEYSDVQELRECKAAGMKVDFQPMSAFSDPSQAKQAKQIARLIQKYIDAGVWVSIHCHLGRDRTGLVVGMWRILFQGATYNQVKLDWVRYGAPFASYQRMLERAAQ